MNNDTKCLLAAIHFFSWILRVFPYRTPRAWRGRSTCGMRGRRSRFLAAVAALGLAGIGNATESGTPDPFASADGGWSYRITPYLWAAGLDGKVAFAGRPPIPPVEAQPSAGFSDVLSNLDFGAMAFFEARRDRVGFFGDLLYIRLSDSASGSVPLPSLPPANVEADVRSTTRTALLAGQYRVFQSAAGSVDLMAGARFWSLNNRIRVAGTVGPVPGSITRRVSASWADPMLGVKGLHHLTPRTYVMGWAMAGGFGIGAESSLDLLGAFGYSFNDRTALLFGYRYLSVDYRREGFRFDAAQHGPGIGFDVRF